MMNPWILGYPYVSLCLDKASVEMIPWSFPFLRLQDSNPMWNESIALAFPKKFEDVPIEDSPVVAICSVRGMGGMLFSESFVDIWARYGKMIVGQERISRHQI